MKRFFRFSAFCMASIGLAVPALAQAPDFWATPVIQGYGRIHLLPDAAYKPDLKETYKIVFLVTKAAKTPDAVNPGLDRVARTVNLYAASGVPKERLKIVAVISGEATPVVLNNPAYHAATGKDNPNLPLISELRKAGVDVVVCGQAVPEHHFAYDQIVHDVRLSLSALTTVTILEHQGYGLLPF